MHSIQHIIIILITTINQLLPTVLAKPPTNHNDNAPIKRIYGGREVHKGEIPYQAAVAVVSNEGQSVVCGGAILSRFVVITAGHCLENGSMSVMVGDVSLDESNTWHKVVNFSTPYINGTFYNDLALLNVDPPIKFGRNAQPVKLPKDVVGVGTTLKMSGWGLVNKESSSDTLKTVNLSVVSDKECSKTWIGDALTKRICAVAIAPSGTCGGDSGGPLVADNVIHGKYHVVYPSLFLAGGVFRSWNWR